MTVPSPAPRQTLSYLRTLLEQHGIRPKNKLGQNFLIDLNLLDLIIRTAELTKEDLVLEVGSGTGSLTGLLADQAGAVVSVEIDPAFQEITQEAVGERSHVRLLKMDVLRNKNHLQPNLLETIEAWGRHWGCTRRKLVANLPYAVATPVISNLLLSETTFERMVVTVQWEIAERLAAQPGSKVYGALSVLAQSLAEIEIIRRLPPNVFWPRPKVDSAIVLIRPSIEKRRHVGDVNRFRAFLRNLYTHRRKNLRGALAGWPNGRKSREVVDAKLAELDLDGRIRAECLDLEDHLRLCSAFGD